MTHQLTGRTALLKAARVERKKKESMAVEEEVFARTVNNYHAGQRASHYAKVTSTYFTPCELVQHIQKNEVPCRLEKPVESASSIPAKSR
jgi:hypothetical protein